MLLQLLPTILVACLIFINGWTDAPNAITGIVVTNTVSLRTALWLAAGCDLLGLALGCLLNASVANTMLSLMSFGDVTVGSAKAALCAAMLAVLVFAVGAWFFGIPTSESHALAAALGGAVLAVGGGFSAEGWPKIILGLGFSLCLGAGLGRFFIRLLGALLRRLPQKLLGRAQLISAGLVALMHGAQDGLKFMAVFVAAEALAHGEALPVSIMPGAHIPALWLCGLAMALGIITGGRRIIQNIGESMVKLDRAAAACADLGSALCLMLGGIFGLPMSTTHTKTAAMLGAGRVSDKRIAGGIALAWGITFPVCGALGYLFARLFILTQN